MKASDIIVQSLVAEGVTHVFGVPGEENLDLLESLRTSSITFIPTRHEAAAGFMAATIGRLTGNPGVALSTLGPGATNLVTAVAYAQLGGMPTLFITGQKPIKNSKQGHFQIIDTVNMMKPLTKLTKQIVSANLVGSSVAHALKLARDERPGAVHLELPEDVAAETTSLVTPPTPVSPRRAIAEPKAIQTVVEMLKKAKTPLLVIGAGANRKRVGNMLNRLIDQTGIPFCATQMGKGVVSEARPEYLGTTALSAGDYIHQEIAKADLIINIGHDTIEKPPYLPTQAKIVHLNFSPATPDTTYHADYEVIGDIANAIWQITEALVDHPNWDLSVYEPVKNRADSSMSKDTLSPYRIITELRQVLGDDDIVALDNGMYKLYFARHYETRLPNTLLLDNALATMGAGLPSAIAAKLINPAKKVVAVVGDGGFLMSSAELETARRLGIDLTILLLRDNGYGMISWKQQAMNLPNFGLNFDNPDFVAYAASFGAEGYAIDSVEDLTSSLQTALSKPGVHLLDIPIDYTDNQNLKG